MVDFVVFELARLQNNVNLRGWLTENDAWVDREP